MIVDLKPLLSGQTSKIEFNYEIGVDGKNTMTGDLGGRLGIIKVHIIDRYFGNMTMTLGFKGDEVGVYMEKTAEFFLDEYQGFAHGIKMQ